ncbi:hypothetical protein HYDPIDRAFT_170545 [Hydnomerulius pinastri MD-312]|uniref:Uncharacterized protein n=1 Tax=Hydnomerulius pinastri MD-312 TaxID=994086 RepID=A0A0C9WA85_9AGAM|nr:hypothetical protein HYDPIDRAFT_170545 [Hydnomerulius pinastri MD-312]
MTLGSDENRSPTTPRQQPTRHAPAKKKATATRQSKSARPATRDVLQDKNNELSAEVERLMAQLRQAQETRDTADKAAQAAETARAAAEENARGAGVRANGSTATRMIARPSHTELNKGPVGRLARAMGLENKKSDYLAIVFVDHESPEWVLLGYDIQASVHHLCSRVGLDFNVKFVDQPPAALGKLFRLARHSHPELERFQNDWATAALVRQYLQNKRKQENKKRKAEAEPRNRGNKRSRFDDYDDDEEDNEDEDEEETRRGSGRSAAAASGDLDEDIDEDEDAASDADE